MAIQQSELGLSTPELVNDVSEVTSEWLTKVLRYAGKITDAEVVDFEAKAIGVGQTSRVFEFNLVYDKPNSSNPALVVAKFPSLDEGSLTACRRGNVYVTEVNFYNELKPTLNINTPEVYFAGADPDDNARFVIAMQDMSPALPADTIVGCSVEEAKAALKTLAGLHGPRWGDPTLREISWLRKKADGLANEQKLYQSCLPAFIERFGHRLDAHIIELLEQVGENYVKLMTSDTPETVIHSDFRPDNFLFKKNGDLEVSVVDYQGAALFQGAIDIAYFLCGSPESLREHQVDLIKNYHSELLRYGVQNYSFEQCYDDYRRFSVAGLRVAVYAGVSVIQTERGDEMFARMATSYSTAALDLGIKDFF